MRDIKLLKTGRFSLPSSPYLFFLDGLEGVKSGFVPLVSGGRTGREAGGAFFPLSSPLTMAPFFTGSNVAVWGDQRNLRPLPVFSLQPCSLGV